eukprot:CAMPEP_0170570998 /NCGR_PEP_ID=MMETSP0224-20130122/1422_1 /TAXON_ID=285029 /ORGANISM="Togula jolla, Strain CCCM 725" /LENGTH=89 /DNA_ID=CAMNT_0010893339 /DNA_START=798 /DNA_END=1068 /DNA_ORIENTATION=+
MRVVAEEGFEDNSLENPKLLTELVQDSHTSPMYCESLELSQTGGTSDGSPSLLPKGSRRILPMLVKLWKASIFVSISSRMAAAWSEAAA